MLGKLSSTMARQYRFIAQDSIKNALRVFCSALYSETCPWLNHFAGNALDGFIFLTRCLNKGWMKRTSRNWSNAPSFRPRLSPSTMPKWPWTGISGIYKPNWLPSWMKISTLLIDEEHSRAQTWFYVISFQLETLLLDTYKKRRRCHHSWRIRGLRWSRF